MVEFDGERVRGRHLTDGFTNACTRLRQAQSHGDAVGAFQALFEALSWVHAIDDYIARVWSPRGKVVGRDWRDDPALPESLKSVLDGLRYARNRVHHQWADAVAVRDGAWVWRSVDELPTPTKVQEDRRGRAAYDEVLAGRAVEDALRRMVQVFTFFGALLDPLMPIPRRPIVEVVTA
jgi:hypothetical protein